MLTAHTLGTIKKGIYSTEKSLLLKKIMTAYASNLNIRRLQWEVRDRGDPGGRQKR